MSPNHENSALRFFFLLGSLLLPACAPEIVGHKAVTQSLGLPLVLGQPDFTTIARLKTGFQDPIGSCTDGTRLVIVERTNHRVLIWNQMPTQSLQPADLVLGQPDLTGNLVNHTPGAPGTVSAKSLAYPTSCLITASGLIVADRNNHRVLIWSTFPVANQQGADLVLCQPDMVSNTANNGGVSAQSCSQPYSLASSGGKLLLSDINNARILIWNTIPTSNRAAANVVVGQPNMTSNTQNNGGVTAQSLNGQARALTVAGGKLFHTDAFNHRVLIWNTIPTANFAAADVVLGQPNMTSSALNNTPGSVGTVSSQSMYWPRGVWSDGTRLFVAEYGNNRVLIWNSVPNSNQTAADLVLGQPGMASGSVNNTPGAAGTVSAYGMNNLHGISGAGSKLVVGDYLNQRILIWNNLPTVNQAAPDLILGQASSTTNVIGGMLSAQTISAPSSITGDETRLMIADPGSHRILLWNSHPVIQQGPADLVLGQADLTSNTANSGGLSAQSLSGATSVHWDHTRLLAADSGNHRVLIWNSLPTANQSAASVVLGQPGFVSGTANNGGISSMRLNNPTSVFSDGTRLFVADTGNHRILIWNSMPTSNSAAADIVLGQASFVASTPGTSASQFNAPNAVFSDGTRLFVSDSGNHRVLIWNSVPTVSQTPADLVLGQPTLIAGIANNGGVSAQSLSAPTQIFVDAGRLYVADSGNHRVLQWNVIPTMTRAAADRAIGQADLFSGVLNNTPGAPGTASLSSLYNPQAVFSDGFGVYVGDTGNSRVLILRPQD